MRIAVSVTLTEHNKPPVIATGAAQTEMDLPSLIYFTLLTARAALHRAWSQVCQRADREGRQTQ